jgi:acyl carrier protein
MSRSCSKASAADRARTIIAAQFSRTVDELTDAMAFRDDLGADALDIIELVMAIEEDLNVSLPDSVVEEALTVGALLKHLTPQMEAAHGV